MHHIHFNSPAALEMQAWYAKTFGAVPGKRGQFDAALTSDLDAVEPPSHPHDTERVAEGREELRSLMESIETLPEDRRDALIMRFASQGKGDYTDRLLAMMRNSFGGHKIEHMAESSGKAK